MRSNLLSLQNTQDLMDMTQERLSTGKKVNSAIDNPSSYYTAQSLTNRASDLSSLLDSMGQAIQTIQAADEGIEAITDFADQAKAVANSARDSSEGDSVANYMKQFDWVEKVTVNSDAISVAEDGTHGAIAQNAFFVYNGSLYQNTGTQIGEDAEIDVNSANVKFLSSDADVIAKAADAGTTNVDVNVVNDTTKDAIDASITQVEAAISKLRTMASEFGNNYSIVQNREDFTENLINVLEEGADKLTLADMNEESANMLALPLTP